MSFGISIGDFIALADKAAQVYNRCKNAPSDFADLAAQADVLRYILCQTGKFVNLGDLPDHQYGLKALATAHTACDTTLTELDTFLEKWSKPKLKKSVLSRMKFIHGDVDRFKKTLQSNATYLQLGLSTLSSVSVYHVRNELKTIHRDYKIGLRESTVLSGSIRGNETHKEDEVYEQLVSDLEDNDVHPDAVSLNARYVRQCAQSLAKNGGSDPDLWITAPERLQDHRGSPGSIQKKQLATKVSDPPSYQRTIVDNTRHVPRHFEDGDGSLGSSSYATTSESESLDNIQTANPPSIELDEEVLDALGKLSNFSIYAKNMDWEEFERLSDIIFNLLDRSYGNSLSMTVLEVIGLEIAREVGARLGKGPIRSLCVQHFSMDHEANKQTFRLFVKSAMEVCTRERFTQQFLSHDNAFIEILTSTLGVYLHGTQLPFFGWRFNGIKHHAKFRDIVTGHHRNKLPKSFERSFRVIEVQAVFITSLQRSELDLEGPESVVFHKTSTRLSELIVALFSKVFGKECAINFLKKAKRSRRRGLSSAPQDDTRNNTGYESSDSVEETGSIVSLSSLSPRSLEIKDACRPAVELDQIMMGIYSYVSFRSETPRHEIVFLLKRLLDTWAFLYEIVSLINSVISFFVSHLDEDGSTFNMRRLVLTSSVMNLGADPTRDLPQFLDFIEDEIRKGPAHNVQDMILSLNDDVENLKLINFDENLSSYLKRQKWTVRIQQIILKHSYRLPRQTRTVDISIDNPGPGESFKVTLEQNKPYEPIRLHLDAEIDIQLHSKIRLAIGSRSIALIELNPIQLDFPFIHTDPFTPGRSFHDSRRRGEIYEVRSGEVSLVIDFTETQRNLSELWTGRLEEVLDMNDPIKRSKWAPLRTPERFARSRSRTRCYMDSVWNQLCS